MTTFEFSIDNWTSTSIGKAARLAIAILGVVTATLTLMLAAVIGEGAWVMLLAGVALAATSVMAARDPSLARLTAVAANLIAIPLLMRLG